MVRIVIVSWSGPGENRTDTVIIYTLVRGRAKTSTA